MAQPWPKRLTLPISAVTAAIEHAEECRMGGHSSEEAVGFFAWKYDEAETEIRSNRLVLEQPGFLRVEYLPAVNVSAVPEIKGEVDARWIAERVVCDRWNLLALFHSHPAGDAQPSAQPGGDYDAFPRHYVSKGLIWGYKTPDKFAMYGEEPGFFEYVDVKKVEIDVAKSL